MKKIVILISGKMRVGKNQFAEFITTELKKLGKTVIEDAFANGVKIGCKQDFKSLASTLEKIAEEIKRKIGLFVDMRSELLNPSILTDINMSIDKLYVKDNNWKEDKTEISRSLLQIYGTNIFRDRIDQNYWVEQLKTRLKKSTSDFIIVTDCRFPNEIENIFSDDYETILVRINRKYNNESVHISETALDKHKEWNYVIDNNGDLQTLKESAKTTIKDILKGLNEDI